jgi:hypothetical protein
MDQKVGNATVAAPSTMRHGQRHERELLLWRIQSNSG